MNYISRFVNGLIKVFQSKDMYNEDPNITLVDLHPDTRTEITIHLLPGGRPTEGKLRCIVNGIHYPPNKPHISFYNSWPTKDVMFTSKGLTHALFYKQETEIKHKLEGHFEYLLSKVYYGENNPITKGIRANPSLLSHAVLRSIGYDSHALIVLRNNVISIDNKDFFPERLLPVWNPENNQPKIERKVCESGEHYPKALLEEIMARLEQLEKDFESLVKDKDFIRSLRDGE